MTSLFFKKNFSKGAVAILLTLFVLAAIILIALGLSNIFVGELKVSSLIRQSGPAYYAAESGTEYALYHFNKLGETTGQITEGSAVELINGAEYWVSWDIGSIFSVGKYAKARRKIEVRW